LPRTFKFVKSPWWVLSLPGEPTLKKVGAMQILSNYETVKEWADSGEYVLGICNGFQILTESHLLPGALKRNNNLHFISKFQRIKVVNSDNKFLSRCSEGEIFNVPVAHAEGNYYIDDEGTNKS